MKFQQTNKKHNSPNNDKTRKLLYVVDIHNLFIIRLGLNVASTHQNRSYRDSETKET